jgi:hypothetical protein
LVADERKEPHYNPRMLPAEKISDGAGRAGHPLPRRARDDGSHDADDGRVHRLRTTTTGDIPQTLVDDDDRRHVDLRSDCSRNRDAMVLGCAATRDPQVIGRAGRLARSAAGAGPLGHAETSPGTWWRRDAWPRSEGCPGCAVSSAAPRPPRHGLVLSAIGRIYAPIRFVAVRCAIDVAHPVRVTRTVRLRHRCAVMGGRGYGCDRGRRECQCGDRSNDGDGL